DLVAALIQDEVAELEHVPRQRPGRAPQDRGGSGDDLREAERLRDVVVAARPERLDLVLGAVLRGQEEHRGLDALRAEPAVDHEDAPAVALCRAHGAILATVPVNRLRMAREWAVSAVSRTGGLRGRSSRWRGSVRRPESGHARPAGRPVEAERAVRVAEAGR